MMDGRFFPPKVFHIYIYNRGGGFVDLSVGNTTQIKIPASILPDGLYYS